MDADERGCNCSSKLAVYRVICVTTSIALLAATFNSWYQQQKIAELRSVIDETSESLGDLLKDAELMKNQLQEIVASKSFSDEEPRSAVGVPPDVDRAMQMEAMNVRR